MRSRFAGCVNVAVVGLAGVGYMRFGLELFVEEGTVGGTADVGDVGAGWVGATEADAGAVAGAFDVGIEAGGTSFAELVGGLAFDPLATAVAGVGASTAFCGESNGVGVTSPALGVPTLDPPTEQTSSSSPIVGGTRSCAHSPVVHSESVRREDPAGGRRLLLVVLARESP